ncbi:mitochondrial fission 1 protein-like [Nilaparvata lugens]|uniref:mitochondrial fission 1 protein n=1 Tax=Nilaparvata lugens TaxID=108931 RepID=UPI000B9992E3|nr:mitochondrial fission 1 protein [Nilaparvata lugens]XP_039280862.1 mitochondrial fission 1 protein-like [Nilaparvata lugens]
MDIEEILNDVVPSDQLKKAEESYYKASETGQMTKEIEFYYANCLVRSKYPADVRKGLSIFEAMCKKYREEEKRDYIYFLALGNARIKEYSKALHFAEAFLTVEPNNKQVMALEEVVKKKLRREGLEGAAVAGAAGLAIGGIIGLGYALLSKKKSSNDDECKK